MLRVAALVLAFAAAVLGGTERLYLKDGTYQLTNEYKILSDRVSFYSTERSQWEEIPLEMVDLNRTKKEVADHESEVKVEAKAQSEEDAAERAERQEIERIPVAAGAYYIRDDKMDPLKAAESKVVTNKRRSLLKAISPVPLVPGKATLELDGPHSSQGTGNRSPEFYIRLSQDERFGIVRMGEHKGNRVVEKLTIQPVVNETQQEPDLVEVFRQQVADGLFKIWPQKPLEPGEYAVVEYSEEKVNMQVWDFFIAPGTGK